MTNKLRVIFIGTEAWVIPALDALIEKHNVVGVVTKPDSPSGRGHKLTQSPIKEVALRCKIPVFEPDKLSQIIPNLAELKADIGVVIAYGKIIPDEIIELFKYGIINCHPSALPLYRGPSPIETAILDGNSVKVSIIQLSAKMDAGDILAQETLLGDTANQNASELYDAAGIVGAEMIIDVVSGLDHKSIKPIPQDHAKATFSTKITKSDGLIDWSKSAETIHREVRAYAGWPGSKTNLDDIDITITRSHMASMVAETKKPPGTALLTPNGSLAFQTGQGVLVIDSLKPAGKREMTSQEFLAGHPLRN